MSETVVDYQTFARTPRPLGRHVEHDPRSRAFSFVPRADTAIRTKVWRRYGNVLDQGQVGACTGFAAAHALNHLPNYVKGEGTLKNADGLSIYTRATQLDEFAGEMPEQDTGSSGNAACKALLERGLITEYRWAFGFDHLLQSLMHSPVMVGTWWYEDMFYPNAAGLVRPTGSRVGGHEYVCAGIASLTGQMLVFQNSWSQNWGAAGRFYMTFSSFRALLADNGDAVIPVGGPWT